MDPLHGEHRLLLWLFVGVTAAALLVQEGAVTVYDGRTVYAVTESIVERGTIAIDEELVTLEGRGGHHYSSFGPGLSFLGVVPYVLIRPLAVQTGHADKVLEAGAASLMAFVTGALAVALYGLGRQLGAAPRRALFVALGSVAGTFLLPYSKEYFSEPLAALALVVAMERLLAGRPPTSGLALAGAILVRPQTIVVAPLFVLVGLLRHGRRGAVGVALGVLPGVVGVSGYNLARFGEPLEFGYGELGFSNPVWVGVTGLLFEPTKSLFLFAPIVVVVPAALARLWRHDRAAFILLGGNLAIAVALTIKWFAWHGGWSWGPRLVLPGLVPALVAIGPWASSRGRRWIVAALFAAGLAVSAPALVVSTQAQQLHTDPIPSGTPYLPTAPLASPSVVDQVQLIVPTARYSVDHLFDRGDDGFNYLRYLSLWQFGAARLGGPPTFILSLAASGALLVVVVVSWHRVAGALTRLRPPSSPRGLVTT